MVLSAEEAVHLDEFTSLTVFPVGNGHFSGGLRQSKKTIWEEYAEMLTPEGRKTVKPLAYEDLFPLMRKHLRKVPHIDHWIDYLERRYLF